MRHLRCINDIEPKEEKNYIITHSLKQDITAGANDFLPFLLLKRNPFTITSNAEPKQDRTLVLNINASSF